MYNDYFGFKENPFNITADPDFFFSSSTHIEALSSLIYGVTNRKGITLITGEVGTGKTTLARTIIRQLGNETQVAFILNPNFSDAQLLQLIVNDFGIKTKSKDKLALINLLNQHLLMQLSKGINVVLIIDEAQNLSVKQLEQIRLLSNLETEKEKILQIILIGQPELDDKLHLTELRQLRQRIGVRAKLNLLNESDLKDYIQHRINHAATRLKTLPYFTDDAIQIIHKVTKGSPRSINVLCDRALLAAFTEEKMIIQDDLIQHCAKEIIHCEYHL